MILGERNAKTGLAFTGDGCYQAWGDVENSIVYVVRTDQGQDTLSPDEFTERYGWKNDPGKVRLPETRPADGTPPTAAAINEPVERPEP
jgi:hypothetical protein